MDVGSATSAVIVIRGLHMMKLVTKKDLLKSSFEGVTGIRVFMLKIHDSVKHLE